jgi:hypothetical protein
MNPQKILKLPQKSLKIPQKPSKKYVIIVVMRQNGKIITIGIYYHVK